MTIDRSEQRPLQLQRTVAWVTALNLGAFCVEFAVGQRIGSVSLFADSVDFLEDAAINILILVALGWSIRARSRIGMLLAAIILVPGLATAWMAWVKFNLPVAPNPLPLALTGLGALALNLAAALMLARVRHQGGSLTRAAFLSARNDSVANLAIVAAGLATAFLWPTAWPDLLIGVVIGAINADAARDVWRAARREHSGPPDGRIAAADTADSPLPGAQSRDSGEIRGARIE